LQWEDQQVYVLHLYLQLLSLLRSFSGLLPSMGYSGIQLYHWWIVCIYLYGQFEVKDAFITVELIAAFRGNTKIRGLKLYNLADNAQCHIVVV